MAHCIFMKESFGEVRFGYTTLYRPCVPRSFVSIQIWHIFITCKKSHGGPRDPAGSAPSSPGAPAARPEFQPRPPPGLRSARRSVPSHKQCRRYDRLRDKIISLLMGYLHPCPKQYIYIFNYIYFVTFYYVCSLTS